MAQIENPFTMLDALLDHGATELPTLRIVDFHCELTSEKNAFGIHLDGRVSAVCGTHTHVATADEKILPKGTRIDCTAHFDNSPNNPANPDPAKEVKWGDQSWEEMMIGWFEIAIDPDADAKTYTTRGMEIGSDD